MKNKIKLFFKRLLTIIYLLATCFVFILWTITYPLLRKRYKKTKNPNHFPSLILLKYSMFLNKTLHRFIS